MKKVLLPIAFLLLLALQVRAQTIETIAGNGTSGYSGDGGSALLAELGGPMCARFDRTGTLYFADRANNVIRKIDAAGIITTIAGNGYGAETGTGSYAGDNG